MKNILIVLGIILGIAVFAAGSGFLRKRSQMKLKLKKKNRKLWITKTS